MSDNSKSSIRIDNLKKINKILKFLLTIDDLEVIKSSMESVIEMLEEEIKSK